MKLIITIVLLLAFFTVNAQQKGDPPTIAPGLEIKRSKFLQEFPTLDSDMVFKKNTDTLKLEHYTGTDASNISLHLIGSEDDLKIADWVIPLGNNEPLIKRQLKKTIYICWVMGGNDGIAWFNEKLKQIFIPGENVVVNDDRKFDFGRTAHFYYNKKQRLLKITFVAFDYER